MTVTPKFKKRQIQKIAPTERTTDIPKKSFNIKGLQGPGLCIFQLYSRAWRDEGEAN